ncbi:MAG TPA: efflux RND transporter periplasmic adaptor subunit [Bryobacteraceae bacterium]|jgi:cobalt-zinc-cadmium efflux system membrane fusion protein
MYRNKVAYASVFAAALLALLILTGCGTGQDQSAHASPVKKSQDPLKVEVSPALAQHIQIATAKAQDVARSLHAAARIEADAHRVGRVSSPVTGRITEVFAHEGDFVKHWQALATLSSTELSNTQLAYLEAYSRRQLAERAVERADLLLKADVIGAAELQRRKAELQEKIEEVSAARAQLHVLGMSDETIAKLKATREVTSVSHIVASVTGTVIEHKAVPGQVVAPAETVYVIADLSQVWLIADIPEESSGDLHAGKAVVAEIAAFPGEKVRGKLSYVSPTVNPETRTVRIRMNVPNPRYRYKPDMLATVALEDVPQKQIVLPEQAVVREDNKDYVFVQTEPSTYSLREVVLGADLENQSVITSGLDPGERVVIAGAFHLNNERKRRLLAGVE